jgi:hypothetical protein
MKTLTLAALVLIASTAFAWDQHQQQNQHQTVNSNNTVTNSHNNTNTNTATGGSSNANASGGVSSASLDELQQRQTPPAFAPDAYPTAPCRVAGSAGGSSPYFGISIGGSKLDKDCAKRELARLLLAAGQRQAAVVALCSTTDGKDIPNCQTLEQGPPQVAVAPIQPISAPTLTVPEIIVPAPVVNVQLPQPLPEVKPVAPLPLVKRHKSKPCPCVTPKEDHASS